MTEECQNVVGLWQRHTLIVRARLKATVLDGVQFLNETVPVGKTYLVDMATTREFGWVNLDAGLQRPLRCVWDVEAGGWLPLDLLEVLP